MDPSNCEPWPDGLSDAETALVGPPREGTLPPTAYVVYMRASKLKGKVPFQKDDPGTWEIQSVSGWPGDAMCVAWYSLNYWHDQLYPDLKRGRLFEDNEHKLTRLAPCYRVHPDDLEQTASLEALLTCERTTALRAPPES